MTMQPRTLFRLVQDILHSAENLDIGLTSNNGCQRSQSGADSPPRGVEAHFAILAFGSLVSCPAPRPSRPHFGLDTT
jgi:hypothetical protein